MTRFPQPNWWISESRWWYVERPFPWLLIAVYTIPVLVIAAVIVVGMSL